MNDYYIKKPNGRYVRVGYNLPDMCDGFYYRENGRTTSIPYWLGPHNKNLVNIHSLVEICKNDSELAGFLNKLTEEGSDELKEYMELNGFIRGPLKIYNWSCQDLALAVLQWVYNKYEKDLGNQ